MKKYVLGPNAARQLKKLMRGSGETSRRDSLSAGLAFGSEYANPFAVQWAQSANGGSGAWIIWLPSDALLVVDGKPIDVREELEEVGGDYPEGWYLLDAIASTGDDTLYLNITIPDGEDDDAEPTAEFSNEEQSGGDDDSGGDDGEGRVIDLPICDVSTDSSTGAKSVRQYVTSTVIYNDGAETYIAGDGESSEWLATNGKRIMLQGYPGSGDGADEVDNCGLYFTTVSARTDENGNAIPAKIYISVKDKLTSENWAAKTMTVHLPGGGTKIVHFLGCDDVEVYGTDEDSPDPEDEDVCERVISLTGDAYQSAKVDGDLSIKGAQGSGLEVLTKVAQAPAGQQADEDAKNKGGEVILDLKGRSALSNCGKQFGLHEIKYRDANGNIQIYHGLFCGDIDLTQIGKLIRSTQVNCSAAPGGTSTIKFTYTDGTSDTFSVQNGLNGRDGTGGSAEAPDITANTINGHTYLYVDGELVAAIPHGTRPQITATKNGKVTTLFVDGQAVATICDGEDGEGSSGEDLTEMTVITGATFEITGGKLVAKLSRKRIKAVVVENLADQSVNVCDAKEVEVVTSESYSTSTHQFTNTRRKVTVIGDVAATGQTPFTATPLSSE